jgi:hypothetical protein
MAEIFTKKGELILIDDEMLEPLGASAWFTDKDGYARTNLTTPRGRKCVKMHRFIMGLQNGAPGQVDHIDGNRLNNRRTNLRLCTQSQNNCNRGPAPSNTSGYKGVGWNKRRRKWVAKIKINRKVHFLGHFTNPECAYEAYKVAAVKFHGDFAKV